MHRINHLAFLAVLCLGALFLFVSPSAFSEIERYEFKTLDNGNVTLTGFFEDKDKAFYKAVVSQLKTGELLDVVLMVNVRAEGVWGKTKSLFYKEKKIIHKRLSLDLLTDEVSLHRNKTYTSILPLEDLMPSILSFSHLKILDKESIRKGNRYLVNVSLSFHRGVIEEGGIWARLGSLPRLALSYIPETFMNPTLSASLRYKH
jgi:hypothetical protein